MDNISKIHDEDCFFSERKLISLTIDEMYGYINLLENTIFSKLNIDSLKEESSIEYSSMKDIFDDDFMLDMEEEIYRQIEEYEIKNIFNIDNALKEKITDSIVENITESINFIYENDINENEDIDEEEDIDENELYDFVKELVEIYFTYIFPDIFSFCQIPKSIKLEEFDKNQLANNNDILSQKIEILKNQYQPEQRTPEWYEFRNGIMTASNIYKVLGTSSQYNSFIYEKCLPVDLSYTQKENYTNTDNSRNWGQKYEKLTLQIYENKFKTQVSEFGCIKHSKYDYIGASPDGIVTGDILHPHYGRMIEIKNIVNRQITGLPLEAYWVQMQIQMEVCDLDVCNFIETRFKECETIEEWNAIDSSIKQKGIVITNLLSENTSISNYNFVIFNSENDNNTDFIQKYSLRNVDVKWWYMDEFSCVVVPRNKGWFEFILPKLTEAWNTIIREKETGGYITRLPKKRQIKPKCLLPDEVMNIHVLQNERDNNEQTKCFYIGNIISELDKNTVVIKDLYEAISC